MKWKVRQQALQLPQGTLADSSSARAACAERSHEEKAIGGDCAVIDRSVARDQLVGADGAAGPDRCFDL